MLHRLSHFVGVAFLLIPSSVLLAQHAGAPAHFGGASGAASSFSGPAPTLTSPSRSFVSGPAHSPSLRSNQGGHWPVGSQVNQGQHWPVGNPINRPSRGAGYRRNYPLVYAGYPWLIPSGFGLAAGYGLSGEDEPDEGSREGIYQPMPEQAGPPPMDYQQMADGAPSPFRPPYRPANEGQAAPLPAPAPEPARDQPATTLIFRDGRPPAQVRNYALTATTLYAFEGDSRKEIPLSLLNVPATVETNRAAGIDFALPVSR
jgi:hypothetical protein